MFCRRVRRKKNVSRGIVSYLQARKTRTKIGLKTQKTINRSPEILVLEEFVAKHATSEQNEKNMRQNPVASFEV